MFESWRLISSLFNIDNYLLNHVQIFKPTSEGECLSIEESVGLLNLLQPINLNKNSFSFLISFRH